MLWTMIFDTWNKKQYGCNCTLHVSYQSQRMQACKASESVKTVAQRFLQMEKCRRGVASLSSKRTQGKHYWSVKNVYTVPMG